MHITLFLAVLVAVIVPSLGQWPSQVPFWPNYPGRDIQVLDGTWQFGYTDNFNGDVTSPHINTTDIATPNTTQVPSAFDYRPPGYAGPRGTAFYRTTFTIPKGQTALINFAACSFYCNVYVDNLNLGENRAGGYTPFWVTVPPNLISTTRTLFVVVDNRWNSTTAPLHTGGDFYFFSGIHRSVIVHTSPAIAKSFIQRLEILPVDPFKGIVNISVILGQSNTTSVSLKFTWDDGSSFPESGTATDGVYQVQALVPNPVPWTIANPILRTVTVTLLAGDAPIDSIQARFGLRTVGISDALRITINGEAIKLYGHNRHTMYPDVGPSMTVAQIQSDIAILKDLGDNYVRGAHYPQDQRFLDACDEAGIVIWEEALGPGVSTANTQSAYFMHYQAIQLNNMISTSFNHPCVIINAFFNEGPSDDSTACPAYETCVNTIHARNSGRLASWANDHGLADVCLKYADVISFNGYPAWYDHNGNYTYPLYEWPTVLNQAALEYSKPITVSETGCEGLFEWINTTSVPWGQAYQAQVIPNDIQAILSITRVSGLTLWVFADFKGSDSAQSECGPCSYYPGTNNASYINVACDGKCGLGCRPCGENHKGTVDFWRREKLVYPTVKKMYNSQWP